VAERTHGRCRDVEAGRARRGGQVLATAAMWLMNVGPAASESAAESHSESPITRSLAGSRDGIRTTRCTQDGAQGDAAHSPARCAPYAPPEPCPSTSGGKVVRRGVFVSGKHTRQRQGCTAPDWYKGAKASGDPLHVKHPFTAVQAATMSRATTPAHTVPSCAPFTAVTRSRLASTGPTGRPGSTGQPTTAWAGTRTSLSSKECQTPWPSPLPRPGLASRRCSQPPPPARTAQLSGHFRSVRPTSLTASQRMHQPATYLHGHRADSQLWTQPGG
jgi:hypothetical protein